MTKWSKVIKMNHEKRVKNTKNGESSASNCVVSLRFQTCFKKNQQNKNSKILKVKLCKIVKSEI